jgi:Lrp/AsnC family leucine-responsive transcriptional regulator
MTPRLDPIDRKLLALVQADSSLPYAVLGEAVGLSVSAVNERVRKLERIGAIRGYVALLDPAAAGAPVLAFVEIGIAAPGRAEWFFNTVAARPEVLEAHRTTGSREFLLKLRASSLARLESLIDEIIGSNAAIAATRVTLVLHSAKDSPVLPVDEAG